MPHAEGDQRQGHPAPAGHHAFAPQLRVDHRQIRASQSAAQAARQDRQRADAAHRIAERMRGLGRFAHRAQQHAGPRAIQEPRQQEGQRYRRVHQRMQREHRAAQPRDVTQPGQPGLARPERTARIGHAGEGRQPRPQQHDREAAAVLAGIEHHDQQREPGGQRGTCPGSRRQSPCGAAGVEGRGEAGGGGQEHHALGPEIDHARALVDGQPERRQGQRRAGVQGRGQERQQTVHAGHLARAAGRRQRMR